MYARPQSIPKLTARRAAKYSTARLIPLLTICRLLELRRSALIVDAESGASVHQAVPGRAQAGLDRPPLADKAGRLLDVEIPYERAGVAEDPSSPIRVKLHYPKEIGTLVTCRRSLYTREKGRTYEPRDTPRSP